MSSPHGVSGTSLQTGSMMPRRRERSAFNWGTDTVHALLTDVLKGRISFDGLVVGAWNGHAQVSGFRVHELRLSRYDGVDAVLSGV
jgi:hypothetical protein